MLMMMIDGGVGRPRRLFSVTFLVPTKSFFSRGWMDVGGWICVCVVVVCPSVPGCLTSLLLDDVYLKIAVVEGWEEPGTSSIGRIMAPSPVFHVAPSSPCPWWCPFFTRSFVHPLSLALSLLKLDSFSLFLLLHSLIHFLHTLLSTNDQKHSLVRRKIQYTNHHSLHEPHQKALTAPDKQKFENKQTNHSFSKHSTLARISQPTTSQQDHHPSTFTHKAPSNPKSLPNN